MLPQENEIFRPSQIDSDVIQDKISSKITLMTRLLGGGCMKPQCMLFTASTFLTLLGILAPPNK